jgi:hypothetical protein
MTLALMTVIIKTFVTMTFSSVTIGIMSLIPTFSPCELSTMTHNAEYGYAECHNAVIFFFLCWSVVMQNVVMPNVVAPLKYAPMMRQKMRH